MLKIIGLVKAENVHLICEEVMIKEKKNVTKVKLGSHGCQDVRAGMSDLGPQWVRLSPI